MKKSMWLPFIAVFLVSTGAGSALAWEMLGEKKVDFNNDNDRIQVGKSEGRFREIQVRVKDAPVEIHSMVLTFGNGSTFEPNLKEKFRADSQSRPIELPGDRKRTIKEISFKYESIKMNDGRNKGRGNAEIEAAIRRLERAGYTVTAPKDSGRPGGRGSQKATVQVWGQ